MKAICAWIDALPLGVFYVTLIVVMVLVLTIREARE